MKNTLLQNGARMLALTALLFVFTHLQAQAPTEKQLQEIEKIMAPAREKLIKYLEADKTGQYKTYMADLETISKEQDKKRRDELITLLEKNHIAFIRKAYKAVINHEEQYRAVVKIMGSTKFTYGEFGQILIDFTSPAAALPVRFDVDLVCPMEVKDESSNAQIASICDGRAGNCSLGADAIAEIAGGCKAKASGGNKFDLPNGPFTKINVSAQTDFEYNGFAFAVAGYGQVNSKFGIRFQAPGIDKVVIAKDVFALAPLIWFARVEGQSTNFVAQTVINGSFAEGTTVVAQAYIESFALSVPLFSLTIMDASTTNIDLIRLSAGN